MTKSLRERLLELLRKSERYTRTDMVYLAQSGFWINLGNIILAASSFLLYIVFAHALTKETYGTYQYFLSLSALLGSLTLTGMNYAVTQAVARGYEGNLLSSVRLQLRLGIIPLAAALCGGLYYLVMGNTLIAEALLMMGLLVPAMSAYNTFGAFLVGKKGFRGQFVYSMFTYVPTYALLGFTAIYYPHPLALLIVNLGVQTVIIFLIYRNVQRTAQTLKDEGSDEYGVRLSVVNFFSAAVGQIDSVLAFHYLGPAQLAIYSFATAIPDRAGGLLKFVYTAALPNFSNRPHHEIQASLLGKCIRMSVAALFAAGAYALVAPYIFSFIFPQYVASTHYSQLYSLTMLAYATNILVAAIVSQRYLKEFAIFNISSSFLQMIMQLAGVIFFGLWGLIVAKILSNVASGVIAAILFVLKSGRRDTE